MFCYSVVEMCLHFSSANLCVVKFQLLICYPPSAEWRGARKGTVSLVKRGVYVKVLYNKRYCSIQLLCTLKLGNEDCAWSARLKKKSLETIALWGTTIVLPTKHEGNITLNESYWNSRNMLSLSYIVYIKENFKSSVLL